MDSSTIIIYANRIHCILGSSFCLFALVLLLPITVKVVFTNSSKTIIQMQQINNYCKHHQNPVIFTIDFMAINVNNHRDAVQINLSCFTHGASCITIGYRIPNKYAKHPCIRVTSTSNSSSNSTHRIHLSMQK